MFNCFQENSIVHRLVKHSSILYILDIFNFLLYSLHARAAFPDKYFYKFLSFFSDDGSEQPPNYRR